jgi:hypothetical protein
MLLNPGVLKPELYIYFWFQIWVSLVVFFTLLDLNTLTIFTHVMKTTLYPIVFIRIYTLRQTLFGCGICGASDMARVEM